MLEESEGTIKNQQPIDMGNIGHRTKTNKAKNTQHRKLAEKNVTKNVHICSMCIETN
jgi:hypothetical protein